MSKPFDRRWLIVVVAILLGAGFVVTALLSFSVSRDALRQGIVVNELPLTTDNIYAEIRKDLTTPILVSSMMANDTFLRDWVLNGEQDNTLISKYLTSIKERYGAVSAFLISDKTRNYYYPNGILKTIDEHDWRDAWYFRVQKMTAPYEVNVDFDMANHDAWTIFINHRTFDYSGKFIGATGVGLTFTTVSALIDQYERRYQRRIYFVDHAGRVVVSGHDAPSTGRDIHTLPGLGAIADKVLKDEHGTYDYADSGQTHLLVVRLLPEINWYVFVERIEDEAIASVREALFINLGIALAVTVVVVFLVGATIIWYQRGLERMATTDKLTGLVNRQAFDLLLDQGIKQATRTRTPISLMMLDIDYFKSINDKYGHLTGDKVIQAVAQAALASVRKSDVVCRWGGEEFLVMLSNCDRDAAFGLAEKVRAQVEQATAEGLSAVKITVSLGATQMQDIDTENSLLARVDEALYEAKRAGRNRTILA